MFCRDCCLVVNFFCKHQWILSTNCKSLSIGTLSQPLIYTRSSCWLTLSKPQDFKLQLHIFSSLSSVCGKRSLIFVSKFLARFEHEWMKMKRSMKMKWTLLNIWVFIYSVAWILASKLKFNDVLWNGLTFLKSVQNCLFPHFFKKYAGSTLISTFSSL